MELSAKYAAKVWEKRSFSAAAASLFISQPSLSATITKLERELGFRIFDRSTIPISLTPQGSIYMEYLGEMMESENNMKQRIRSLDDMSGGSLRVGGQMYCALEILPKVCGEFYRRYPKISVTLDMGDQRGLQERMKKNSLDLLLSYEYDPAVYEAVPLLEERLIIVMHKSMPQAEKLAPYAVTREQILNRSYPLRKELEDLSIFRDVSFIMLGKGDAGHRLSLLLKDYQIAPCRLINVRHFGVYYRMMQEGIGAVMVTDFLVSTSADDGDNLLYFVPKHACAQRTLYILKKRE